MHASLVALAYALASVNAVVLVVVLVKLTVVAGATQRHARRGAPLPTLGPRTDQELS